MSVIFFFLALKISGVATAPPAPPPLRTALPLNIEWRHRGPNPDERPRWRVHSTLHTVTKALVKGCIIGVHAWVPHGTSKASISARHRHRHSMHTPHGPGTGMLPVVVPTLYCLWLSPGLNLSMFSLVECDVLKELEGYWSRSNTGFEKYTGQLHLRGIFYLLQIRTKSQ